MKLKWYDWDGVGEIPSGVKEVCFGDGGLSNLSLVIKDSDFWVKTGFNTDIIAYTLGEPLEGGELDGKT